MKRRTCFASTALVFILLAGMVLHVDAAVQSDLSGEWDAIVISELGKSVYSFVVPEIGPPTLNKEPAKDFAINDNEITFSVVLMTGSQDYPLDFEGTYDETVIVGEFLMADEVVALVNMKRK